MKIAFMAYRDWAVKIGDELPYEFTDIGKADVVLYYGWSEKIPKEIYENKMCLILHPSPLPKYRGGSPLQHQIMAGEKTSAVTICRVASKLDSGDIYSQTPFSLEGTLDEIFERIIDIGLIDTIDVLRKIEKGTLKPYKQINSKASTFYRRKPKQSELTIKDFKNKSAYQLNNFIRSLADPYPNAFIRCKDGKKLYFTGSHL